MRWDVKKGVRPLPGKAFGDFVAGAKPVVENPFERLNEPVVWRELTRRLRLFLYVLALLYIDAILFQNFGFGCEVPRFSMARAWLRSPEELCFVVYRGLTRTSLFAEQIESRVKTIESSWDPWWDRTLRLFTERVPLGDGLRLLFLRDFHRIRRRKPTLLGVGGMRQICFPFLH